MLREAVTVFNPHVVWDGSIFMAGLDRVEAGIAVLALLLLCVVSVLQQKGSVREKIAGKPLPLRWILWYGLLFGVILLGCYGPGYSASEFIYQGF